jgi:long-chain acyl-CoA synthetase
MSQPTSLSLVDLLETSVEKYRSRPLFVTKRGERLWTETTYGEFASLVDRLRGGLASLGVRPKDRIGIIANNSIEWAVIAYATYGLGATLVPMYESQLAKERAFITADSGIKVVFTRSPDLYREALALRSSIPTLEHVVLLQEGEAAENRYSSLLAEGDRHPVASVHPQPGETACLLYTSGTTGDPKGVILSHRNVVSNVLALKARIPTMENDRTLSILPWAHSFGHTVELHGVIAAGGSIAIAESIEKILDDLRDVKPTILVAVPRVFLRVHAGVELLMEGRAPFIRWLFRRGLAAAKAKTKGESLGPTGAVILFVADKLVFSKVRARFGGRLKYAVSGGAAMPKEVAEFIDGIGIAVYEGYGLTEASPIVSANVPGSRKLGSVGRLLPGVRVVIDRSQTNDALHGEIVVYGPNVTQGYHNRDDENRAIFTADGGLRTGDMGHLDEDDFLFITGRIKEQYKLTNGKYVVPGPLEDRLKLSPFIASIMIYGDNKAHNVALVVPSEARLLEWSAKQGLRAVGLSDLVAEPKVKDKIRSEIENLSSAFKGYERVKEFALIVEDFTQENDMLTPSLKLKRRNIVQRWSRQLDRLYPQSVVVDENRI